MKFLRSYLEDAGDFIVWLFKTLSSIFASFAEELVEAFKKDPLGIMAALLFYMGFFTIAILLTVAFALYFPPLAFLSLSSLLMVLRGVKS